MEHLKQFKELCLQLSVSFDLDVFVIQPNFITGGIAARLHALIVSSFLKFLDMVEVVIYKLSHQQKPS